MAALQSPISILIRHRHSVRCHMTSLFRFFGTESIYGSETSKPNSRLTFEVAQEVCNMMRTRPRWEQTLVSEFPGFNFSDPSFVQQLLKLQSNLLLSSRFISWCVSHYGCAPDHSSSELLFNALVEAKACNAAKWLIDLTGFEPGPDSFERYNHCLWEGGSIKDAMEASSKLKELAVCPKLGTWNMAFSRCLKLGRNDLVFRLYREFIESGMVADTETVEYLIQAFCDAGKVVEGYELLRQVIEDGIVPRNISFNKLIRGFLRKGETGRMSQLLHLMIEKNQMPDIYTYQEVINGLCKRKMTTEILMIFNNLKSRGYFPDRVMYTTMIQGLCDGGLIGEARKLWFEMISKGLAPNKYTYSAMIHGYFRTKEIVEATKLFHEKPDKSLRESRVFYNNMIRMLSSKGRIGEAWKIFEELPQKGVYRNAITYSAMIQGLCREGKLVVVTGLLKDSLQKGILPLSIEAYVAIFESLCKVGRIQEAQNLCRDMESRGMASTSWYNHVIVGFCKQGSVTEAMDQLVNMLKRGLEPSFEMLLWLLKFVVKRGRMDDSSIVLNSILLRRHSLPKHTLRSIVLGLCTKGGKCKVNSLVQKLCKEGDEASQARIIEGS